MKCSFLEIYNEAVYDLLNPVTTSSDYKGGLRVRETPTRGVWVEGLTEHETTNTEDVERLLSLGELNRTTAFTEMNAESSRSHSIFSLCVVSRAKDGSSKTGILSLVDLAGSEKVRRTGASGLQMEEATNINRSLTSLGRCIFSLTQPGTQHVPYRDSKLTFILRDSLGGNAKTTLIVACSPSLLDAEETLSTLRFAQRAKEIQNVVHVNKEVSVASLHATIKKLQKEITMLKEAQNAGEASPRLSPRVEGLQECQHCASCAACERDGFDCDMAAEELTRLEGDLRLSQDRLEKALIALEAAEENLAESQQKASSLEAQLQQAAEATRQRDKDKNMHISEEGEPRVSCLRCEALMEESALRIMGLETELAEATGRASALEEEVARLRGRVNKQILLTPEEASGRGERGVMKRLVQPERWGPLAVVTPTQGRVKAWAMLKAGFLYVFRREVSDSPSLLVSLGGCTVTAIQGSLFRIETASGRRTVLEAEDEQDQQQWAAAIRATRWTPVDFTSAETAVQDTPSWVPDMDVVRCAACNALFTLTKRRHHCRACGKVVCGSCSDQNLPLPCLGYATPQRICIDCVNRIPCTAIGVTSSPPTNQIALVRKDYEGSPSCTLFSPPSRNATHH